MIPVEWVVIGVLVFYSAWATRDRHRFLNWWLEAEAETAFVQRVADAEGETEIEVEQERHPAPLPRWHSGRVRGRRQG